MIERTEDRFGLKPERLAGDTAYGSGANLDWLVNEAKIAPHIPVIDKSKREDGMFSREDFSFDKERNVYICPAGKVLTTTGKVATDGETVYYRAKRRDCRSCPLKAQCCGAQGQPGQKGRGSQGQGHRHQCRWQRHRHCDARDVAQARSGGQSGLHHGGGAVSGDEGDAGRTQSGSYSSGRSVLRRSRTAKNRA